MKKIIFILLFFPLLAFAEKEPAQPVSVDMQSVSVSELSRLVFSEMMRASYFVAPEILADDRKVSITLKGLKKSEAIKSALEAFQSVGVDVVRKEGVYFLTQKKIDNLIGLAVNGVVASVDGVPLEDKREYEIYRPRHRSPEFLAKVAKFAGAGVPEMDMQGGFVVFAALPEKLEKIKALLASADSLPLSVTIKAALIEYSEGNDKGQSFALDVLTNRLGIQLHAGAALGNSITLQGATIQAVMSAIEGDSRFHYMAQPLLRVNDGERAVLSVGSDVPVRGAVTMDKNGNAVQSVEYRPSGVVFGVLPRIYSEIVTMQIDQQVSSFSTTTTSNIDSPTLLKRAVNTTVNARRGEVIVLAGLDDDKTNETASGLTFLPWLRSSSKQVTKSQLLLVLEVQEGAI